MKRPAPETGLKETLEGWISARRAIVRRHWPKLPGAKAAATKAKVDVAEQEIRAAQIARRIVVSYGGEQALKDFIKMVENGRPGTEIAKKFGVTRQRANQWKDALGAETTTYQVHPVLRRFLGNQPRA